MSWKLAELRVLIGGREIRRSISIAYNIWANYADLVSDILNLCLEFGFTVVRVEWAFKINNLDAKYN